MEIESTEQLGEIIRGLNKKILVFDIFDTIIHRHIHPQDIKKIASSKLKDIFPSISYSIYDIYNIRVEAESKLCIDNYDFNQLDKEFRLTDLATTLYEQLFTSHDKTKLSIENFIEIFTKIELTTELTNQYLDQNIVKIIKEFHLKGYKIFLCSDFYLDKDSIYKLFQGHDLAKYITDIIVSSDYLLTKRTGRLYDHLKEFVNFSDSLMIGDNHESDYIRAKENNLDAIHINRSSVHENYQKKANLFGKELEQMDDLKAEIRNIPGIFPEFSLSAFYFIRKLYNELKKQGFKNAYFLAREGEMLEKLFNIYQNKYVCIDSEKIKTHYLKVSRRATFLPSLKSIDVENFHNLFRQYIRISFSEFMQSLGFELDDINIIGNKLEIDPDKKEEDFPRSSSFLKLVTSDIFIDLYETRRKQQKEYFINYFDQFTQGVKQNNIALIDVGWKGTIQDNIFNIFNQERSIKGYYIGLVVPQDNNVSNSKHGLLFSCDTQDSFFSVFDENRSLFEVLFAANHGSSKYYKINSNGKFDVELEDFSSEEHFFKTNIKEVMSAIEKRFEGLCTLFNQQLWTDDRLKAHVAAAHARMVYMPTAEELDWFLKLYHVENFGVFERNVFNKQSENIGIFDQLLNHIEYKKFPEKFLTNVSWPFAELQKFGLKKDAIKYGSQKIKNVIKSM